MKKITFFPCFSPVFNAMSVLQIACGFFLCLSTDSYSGNQKAILFVLAIGALVTAAIPRIIKRKNKRIVRFFVAIQ